MSSLKPISPKKMVKILKHLGFELIRIKGSHHFFFNQSDKRTTVIPIHSNEDLGRGIMKEILKDIEISVEDFENLKNRI